MDTDPYATPDRVAERDRIAKILANEAAGWHDDSLCDAPECWVCVDARRVADRVWEELFGV